MTVEVQTASSSVVPATGNRTPVLVVSFLLFLVLGMPDGMMGIAFPMLRQEFGLGLAAFGAIFVASTMGFLTSSFLVGRLLLRFPMSIFLIVASVIRALALVGVATLPSWTLVVLATYVLGVGSGAIDAGMNTWFAMRFGPRPMNWLHAFFGFGAMMGPIFLGAILSSGYSWRLGYGLMAVLQIAMALLVLLTARSWAIPASLGESSEPGQVTAQTTMLKTMLVPAVWLGVAVFFFYTGVELTAANWSFTIFTESRGVSLGTAGRWVSLFWFSFTVGRVLFGIIGNRVPVSNLLRGCMLAAVAGAALLAWSPGDSQGLWGLILIGVAVAPIFPLLVSETPLRLGQGLAQHAIGLQMAGASMGIAVIPSLAGVIASRTNLEAIPVFIVAVAAVLFLLHEWMVRATPEGLADHS